MARGFNECKAQKLCKNLLKINETDKFVYITLDVPRSGLDLSYDEICSIIKRFYDKMMWFVDILDERRFRDTKVDENYIILRKY